MLASTRITKIILAVAISALVFGGTALVLGLTAYSKDARTAPVTDASARTLENRDEQSLQETAIFQPSRSGGQITGNLTVYLIPADLQKYHSGSVIDKIYNIIGYAVTATQQSSNLGASRQGQYANENLILTEQIISENEELNANRDHFKVGGTAEMTVIKKPAETVKFYIDPEVKNPVTGEPFTVTDIAEDYSLGNGITCCGIELREDVYPPDTNIIVVIFVVDQAYDELVIEKLDKIRAAIN